VLGLIAQGSGACQAILFRRVWAAVLSTAFPRGQRLPQALFQGYV